MFGRGRYSPYGLVHYISGGIPTYKEQPGKEKEEANRDRIDFFVQEYLDTRPVSYAPVTHRKPSIWGIIAAVAFALSLILLVTILLAGIRIRGIYLLKISDATGEFFVSLWVYLF